MRAFILAGLLALAAPAAALAADDAPSAGELARQACKTEKAEMGTRTFKRTYGVKSTSKAMQRCVAKATGSTETDVENAAQACKDERAGDDAAFRAKYGTNKNGRNAFGKCVSAKAREESEDDTEDRVNAAQACKKLKADDENEFEKTYGSGRNAFGKCVSKTARERDEDDD
jgi:hypothetical protein